MKAASTTVNIPTPLRQFAEGNSSVGVAGKSVGDALGDLTRKYPDLKRHLYGDDGRLRAFVNVYVNDQDIRYLEKDNTPLADGDNISIIPSIAGGCVELQIADFGLQIVFAPRLKRVLAVHLTEICNLKSTICNS